MRALAVAGAAAPSDGPAQSLPVTLDSLVDAAVGRVGASAVRWRGSMPSASQTRRRELARLKARREAERRRARRRRAMVLYGSIGVAVLVLAVVGGILRAGDDASPAAPAAALDARTDAPTAPATVACGGKTPPKVNRPKLDRSPKAKAQANQRYEATLTTSCGEVTFLLDPKAAPGTTFNFVFLAQRHYYDSTWFHRIVPGGPDNIGVIQGGDPKGTGEGGPGYNIPDELPKGKNPYKKYTVAMANSGPNSGGSQFFISTQDNRLDSNYSLFGKVIKGQDVVDKIAKVQTAGERGDTPTEAVWIEKVAIEIT
jgi:peptidyl-prolyl cis-trans isomerase B (cyclophilin B)